MFMLIHFCELDKWWSSYMGILGFLAWWEHLQKNYELLHPTITQFATAFLTLQSLYKQKQALIAMFSSEKWCSSTWAKKVKAGLLDLSLLSFRTYLLYFVPWISFLFTFHWPSLTWERREWLTRLSSIPTAYSRTRICNCLFTNPTSPELPLLVVEVV